MVYKIYSFSCNTKYEPFSNLSHPKNLWYNYGSYVLFDTVIALQMLGEHLQCSWLVCMWGMCSMSSSKLLMLCAHAQQGTLL